MAICVTLTSIFRNYIHSSRYWIWKCWNVWGSAFLISVKCYFCLDVLSPLERILVYGIFQKFFQSNFRETSDFCLYFLTCKKLFVHWNKLDLLSDGSIFSTISSLSYVQLNKKLASGHCGLLRLCCCCKHVRQEELFFASLLLSLPYLSLPHSCLPSKHLFYPSNG